MLRYQCRVIRLILLPNVSYSTRINPGSKKIRISLIQKLSAEFDDVSPIINDLKNIELNNIHFDEWKNRIHTLKRYHFTDKECFKMISRYPCLLKIPLEKFNNCIEQWFASNMKMDSIHSALFQNPHLFEVDVVDIRKRIPKLQSLFGTTDILAKLLINSPNVMFDNWELLLKKIDYLTKLKGYKMGDVVKASALSKSLYFIKFRFDLLEKCGIYKPDNTPIHKVNKYDKSRFVNPHLNNILALNLNDFMAIAKISSEEYAISKDLFMDQEFDDLNEDE